MSDSDGEVSNGLANPHGLFTPPLQWASAAWEICVMSTFPKATTVTTSTLPDIRYDEPAIEFKGRSFCFIGCIEGVFQQVAEEATAERGGLVKSSVVANLDYLIVGPHPNAEPGKVEQALRLRERGTGIVIAHHEHWFECLVHDTGHCQVKPLDPALLRMAKNECLRSTIPSLSLSRNSGSILNSLSLHSST